jgi:hypothetical protein
MTILGNEILHYMIIIFHPKYIEMAILIVVVGHALCIPQLNVPFFIS